MSLKGINQGAYWYLTRLPTELTLNYKMVFEGIVGSSDKGEIVTLNIYDFIYF